MVAPRHVPPDRDIEGFIREDHARYICSHEPSDDGGIGGVSADQEMGAKQEQVVYPSAGRRPRQRREIASFISILANMKHALKIADVQLEAPIRFSPSVERLEPDEAKTIQGLIAAMRYVNEKTLADGGHAIRSVHAKTQGILEGYLEVDAHPPCELAQGLFANPGRYPIVM